MLEKEYTIEQRLINFVKSCPDMDIDIIAGRPITAEIAFGYIIAEMLELNRLRNKQY